MSTRWYVALAAVFLAVGCTSPDDDAGPTSDDDDDDDDGSSWASIVSGDRTLGPNSELTADTYSVTLDRDYYVGGIRPVAPPGTHHTLLATNPSGASGIIYASGLGTGSSSSRRGLAFISPPEKRSTSSSTSSTWRRRSSPAGRASRSSRSRSRSSFTRRMCFSRDRSSSTWLPRKTRRWSTRATFRAR